MGFDTDELTTLVRPIDLLICCRRGVAQFRTEKAKAAQNTPLPPLTPPPPPPRLHLLFLPPPPLTPSSNPPTPPPPPPAPMALHHVFHSEERNAAAAHSSLEVSIPESERGEAAAAAADKELCGLIWPGKPPERHPNREQGRR